MILDVKRFMHVPLYVQAVQVTVDNMADVANWCEGIVVATPPHGLPCVKVATVRPLHPRQTQAYVGDWVLKTDVGLKCYTPKAFERGFCPVPKDNDVKAETDPNLQRIMDLID